MTSAAPVPVADIIGPVLARLASIASRPATLEATGIDPQMIADLVLKHILRVGSLTSASLGERLGLVGTALEPILQFLRQEGRLQLQPRQSLDGEVRLALTDLGRDGARESMKRCGYVGPVPVPLDRYTRVVRAQTPPRRTLSREVVERAFANIIMTSELCDRLGVAMASGRPILIYGPAGSGKTYIATRLIEALPGEVLIPHAIAVNDKIIRVYDATLHEPIELLDGNRRLLLAHGYDARYVLCERPAIIVGGEMTEDMMDVQFNSAALEYSAPLQMKANGGVLVIDDLGRQRFLPQRLFDRWTVTLEQQLDHLTAGADARFSTPCDAVMVFSTNLEPTELADDAVMRRLGYKIELGPLSVELYSRVWSAVCDEMRVKFDQQLLNYVLSQLYRPSGRPLLACHPRDLICMALDKATYDSRESGFGTDEIDWAWTHYFLENQDRGHAATPR